MLCDETTIKIIAGNGGNGMVHFLRAKYVPKGGPDGGSGGRGGNIIFKADENCRTLIDLHRQKIIKAKDGEKGKTNNQNGKTAEDLTLIVPVGTMIYDKNKKNLLADMTKHWQEFIGAKGGKGGFGNTHFKSSRYQSPHFAELGEPGEEKEITLELRLIADVGIIGLPSAGKSSLLNRITRANAKVAPYPFTTLSPNLGVVDLTKQLGEKSASFIIADIPGLIEGASEGKGLGHEFLKHITRTKILIHLIDITNENPIQAKKIIEKELSKFDKKLKQKKQIIAFNKMDLLSAEEIKKIKKRNPVLWKKAYGISAVTEEGIDALMKKAFEMLKNEEIREQKEKKQQKEEYKIFRPYEESKKSFQIKKIKKGYYEITGKRIEQITLMTNITQPEGLLHLRHLIKKLGIQRALVREKAKEGEILIIKEKEIPFRII